MNSLAYGHFGSAQFFMIYDTETDELKVLANSNQHHAHGTCSPMAALGTESIDAVVVGGIGSRAITGLNASGIKVYCSMDDSIEANMEALKSGELTELTPQNACGGHGHDGNCGH